MNFFKLYKSFQNDEDGAVTVDWVVLTAAIVGLGIAVLTSVGKSTTALADKISDQLDLQTIVNYLN
ncbi:Flp family type IVb pilin [Pseudogemmobacter sp. W21_MBD1_M6]|jgi:Flp pilus assembly pilin Flp|uniref:Flp family type IVb pilin n=1 Tax=Pseudogemmobacter sp. W21_MBD1_M6 TaxID=3240271 RepID=UPI003F9DA835